MNKFICSLFMLFLFFSNHAFGQKRIGIWSIQGTSSAMNKYVTLSAEQKRNFIPMVSEIVDFYSNNKDFITIDRQNLSYINNERELQKSEDFMDGYTVAQGKSEGLDLMLSSLYDIDTRNLTIGIINVEDKKVLGSVERILDKNWIGIKDLKQQMAIMLNDLNSKCFDAPISFVRITASKGPKAREALISVGRDQKIKSGYVFEIFEITEEDVNGKKVKRQAVLGEGEVKKVEDDNFSTIEINKGGDVIMTSVQEKKKLFCRLIKN
ncbi:hypothetical protein GVN16_04540 [Emticicia sp. CRIBPO]|uniref:hypothetical protein n=1 Tax=Emticicia sp. CRIBPO TaxID=2683258 RepID=UPI001411D6F4|nr:hypothetical protein [Emticicia sp. CRIBPO]NBA85013.1 hypothetical protein [Emticicia sp. CRIBPO]